MYYIEPPGIYLLYLEGIQLVKFLWNPHKTPSRNAESCCFWVVGWWPVLWNGLFALVRVQVVSKERVKGQIPICLPFEVGVSSVWMKGTVWEPGTVFSPCALSRTWRITCLSQLMSKGSSFWRDTLPSGHLSWVHSQTTRQNEHLPSLRMEWAAWP